MNFNTIQKTDTNNFKAHIQAKRLIQIFWAVELSLLLVLIQRFYLNEYLHAASSVGLAIILTGVHRLAKKDKVLAGSTLLLTLVTAFVTFFMWKNAGLHDEVILAYPCILIMAAMIGDKRLFIGLLMFMCLSISLNGLSNHFQWIANKTLQVNIDSALLVLVILLLISYAIWVTASDFRSLLQKLSHENTEVVKSKNEIEKLLHHDILTGLPNRVMAKEIFNKAVYKAQRDNFKVCIMFIDLDNFKIINDSLGHQAGDELLKGLSLRLIDTINETGSVCRFAGDEFIIIIESVKTDEFLARIAQNILTTIQEPVNYQSNEFICSCSIGISVSPNDGVDFDTLIRNADSAMYHSKSIGGNSFHFFDTEMNTHGHDYLNVVSDLRKALINEEFVLYYQPKIDLITKKIIGAEALIRWQHPSKGLIFPDHFIPQAEKSGLIIEIGDWVIQQACKTCKSWRDAGISDLSVAVNVSSHQFKRGNFSQIVQSSLIKTDLPSELLELEMTESLLIDNSNELKTIIKQLRDLGVSFSIDDFGTGYSNLGYLKAFDIESLKIDRSFVQDIEDNPKNKALVTAIIQMAKSLELHTIAEGVENAEIETILCQLGCDYAQGYHWSKAISEQEFISFAKAFS